MNKRMAEPEDASSDIVVRQHTRKRVKVVPKHEVGAGRKQRNERSMDIASFRLITKIQKDEIRETLAANKANKSSHENDAVREVWQSFMKSSVKASKRAKGKIKSAQRREKKAAKEKKENEIQEFIGLHIRLRAVDFDVIKLSDKEWCRYNELLDLQHCFEQTAYY